MPFHICYLCICNAYTFAIQAAARVRREAMADKKSKKKQRKDSQLIIRINGEDRDAFVTLCDELDTTAAREVRRFIRGFLRANSQSD